MNITLQLQELDNLIVQHTAPPVTSILRNKLHPLLEQMEAYVTASEEKAKRLVDFEKRYGNLKSPQDAKPADILDDVSINMLVALANVGDEGSTDGELIQRLNIPKAKGDLLFGRLRKLGYIAPTGSGNMMRGMFFYVTEKGLEFLNGIGRI